ncbi:hypothetical protein ACP4OV_029933 [Aristida adscensionis]
MATATVRSLPLAVLLALCLAACAGAAVLPTNRYISYAAPRTPRGETAGRGGGTPPGCSAITKCRPVLPQGRGVPGGYAPAETEAGTAGSKATYISNGATYQDPAMTKPGAKMGGDAGPKGRYISRDALSKDREVCPGCPTP